MARDKKAISLSRVYSSILLYEPYANESSQNINMSFFCRAAQFESDHHQTRRLSSHSYSHESVIYFYFLDWRVCVVFSWNACGYAQTAAVENKHCGCGSVHYNTIGDRRLRTVAEATGLWDAESIIFNRGRSVASWAFMGRVFHHAQRPIERAPS